MFEDGVTKGREKIKDYAGKLMLVDNFSDLKDPLKTQISTVLTTDAGVEKFCVNNLVYP
jgi:hypothetical protein